MNPLTFSEDFTSLVWARDGYTKHFTSEILLKSLGIHDLEHYVVEEVVVVGVVIWVIDEWWGRELFVVVGVVVVVIVVVELNIAHKKIYASNK